MQYYKHLVKWFFILLMLQGSKEGYCQQDPVFNQYMNNLLTVQPAYAGMTGYLNVTALSRIQWVGFDGAPTTNTLTIQGPFQKYNVGLGFSLINDQFGPVRQNGIYIDYAYRILLNDDQYISFGMKGGFNQYEALLSELTTHDPNDPVSIQDINQKYLPNFGVGFLWHSDLFFLGVSVPKFFKNKITAESGISVYQEEVNFYGMGGFVVPISGDAVKFKPTFLYRWSQRTPGILDLTANFLFFDRVWAGGTYRVNNSYGLLFQAFIDRGKQLKLGYAYDLTTFHPTQANAGTHEFMLSYDFPYKRRRYCRFTPRYF